MIIIITTNIIIIIIIITIIIIIIHFLASKLQWDCIKAYLGTWEKNTRGSLQFLHSTASFASPSHSFPFLQ